MRNLPNNSRNAGCTAQATSFALIHDRAALLEELALSARAHEDLRASLLAQHVRPDKLPQTGMLDTTVGRVLFNMALPRPLQFVDDVMDKKRLNDFVGLCYELMGSAVTAEVVDEIKRLGFTYATISGMTIAVSDIVVPDSKQTVLDETARASKRPSGSTAVG